MKKGLNKECYECKRYIENKCEGKESTVPCLGFTKKKIRREHYGNES